MRSDCDARIPLACNKYCSNTCQRGAVSAGACALGARSVRCARALIITQASLKSAGAAAAAVCAPVFVLVFVFVRPLRQSAPSGSFARVASSLSHRFSMTLAAVGAV